MIDWMIFAWGLVVGAWLLHGFHIFIVRGGKA